ncbi:hypothetical protein EIP86_011315 [Pleurotus ostreatoroseus]|nr:hypothetical protein EIP86_011315 [Pleurotus ostreatoroseus]
MFGLEGVEFLSACAGYFDAMTEDEAKPALSSVIQICHLVFLISLTHDINDCNAKRHGGTCAATYALLKEIDNRAREPAVFNADSTFDSSDGLGVFASRNVEDKVYKTWLAKSGGEEDNWVPVVFMNALLRHVCDTHTQDEEGRTFRQVRRLREQPEQESEPEGTAAAVSANAEKTENTPYASTPLSDAVSSPRPLLPLMDSSLPLCDIAKSSGPGVTSDEVAPADTLPSHIYHPHTAAKEEATSATTELLSKRTTIPPHLLAIEPVIEELAASSTAGVDIDAFLAAHPVDGLHEDRSLARLQLERDIAPMAISEPSESAASPVVSASVRSGPIEEATRPSTTIDYYENIATGAAGRTASMANETGVEVIRAGRDEQIPFGRTYFVSPQHAQPDLEQMIGLEGVPVDEDIDSATRVESRDALAIPGRALDPTQLGIMLDSEQPAGASEDESEESGQ